MRVMGLSASDSAGGAARAALRIHQALRGAGVDASLRVNHRALDEPGVEGPRGPLGKAAAILRPRAVRPLLHLGRNTGERRSLALLPSSVVRSLNLSEADVVNLHWVMDEMLSIEDIGRITKPVVWTLHDMWAFCGAEHLSWDDRYRVGYAARTRPTNEFGLDLNRLTWYRKRRAWKRPIQIVTPSRWLAQCVRESELMRGWPVEVIPNPLDSTVWVPVEKVVARQLLGIRPDAQLVAFGSMGENHAYHKGGDLLIEALRRLRGQVPNLELVVFGERLSGAMWNLEIPTHFVGVVHDELSLRIVYSAAEALVVPSRRDNLPNTAVEALSCGTPVVAFDTCGLPDLVVHEETGFLARAFEPEDLARGIHWVVAEPDRCVRLSRNARAFAREQFSPPRIAAQYLEVYRATLARFRGVDT
jgi:glycosyltransferase involved in cell wall biosynthesis